jgi:signal transduction histidine kinase
MTSLMWRTRREQCDDEPGRWPSGRPRTGAAKGADVRALRDLQRWVDTRPLLVDAGLAAGFLLAGLVAVAADLQVLGRAEPGWQPPSPLILIGIPVLTCVPLAWRRRRPLRTLVVVSGGFLLGRFLDHPDVDVALFAVPVAVYSAAAYGHRGRGKVLAAVTVGCLMELAYELFTDIDAYSGLVVAQAFDLAYNSAVFLVPWALGASMRVQRERGTELAVAAEELQQRRDADARRAVAEERVRIARELHDVVAHHVSVIGVQAGAVRHFLRHEGSPILDSLSGIERSSRLAIQELQRTLTLLRESSTDPASRSPRLAEIKDLLTTVSSPGLEVRLREDGPPRDLPASVESTAYRLVQEAVTNALKHSRAGLIEVRLSRHVDELEVTVCNDRAPRSDVGAMAPSPSGPAGHGLVGMRERVALHGGSLQAGPVGEDGFRVHAVLPVSAEDR